MTGGFSLLELLVAVLVVAAGVLGVAGLQLASSENNRSAMEHSLATMAAADIVERMRANPSVDYRAALGMPPPAFVDCLANACAPAQLAQFDLTVWKCVLGEWRDDASCRSMPDAVRPSTLLPRGDGAVGEFAGSVTVTVIWGSARDAFEITVPR